MNNPCLLLLDGMELQLGLALPSNPIMGGRFDLNRHVYEPKEVVGSNLLNHGPYKASKNTNDNNYNNKKRSFDEAFECNRTVPLTLPLLFWNHQPNEEDDPKDLDKSSSFIINKNDGDEDGVIGWPPINSWLKKHCYNYNHGGRVENDPRVENVGVGGGSNSKYVKVKMEGVAITRKVDLSIHHSYQTLTDTLINMFGKCHENIKSYRLAYQDREGDWLLAGDIPWRTFVLSALRLKLLKTGG